MRAAFIGDEVTAAGLRLAGVAIHDEGQAHLGQLYQRLLADNEFVLITPTAAEAIGMATVKQDLRRSEPLVAILPSVIDGQAPPDFIETVRAHLGIRSDIVAPD